MTIHTYLFTDQEVADLVRAIVDAQEELCTGLAFPEATAQDRRWEALLKVLQDDKAHA